MSIPRFPAIHVLRPRHLATLTVFGLSVLLLGACGPSGDNPSPPSVEWNPQKYGPEPAHRPLSAVAVTTEAGWVVAREKPPVPAPSAAATNPPAICTAHLRIGGMDCGDCQHLVADELGKLVGVRQARISQPAAEDLVAGKASTSQSPPEAVVEYDPGKVTPKQIEGTISNLGLWPKPLP